MLARHVAELTPPQARILDVGCGDGLIGALVEERRPDLAVRGIDIAVREDCHIPVEPFDGLSIPVGAREIDVVMLMDVLHHADHPLELLAEAARVARRAIIVKDHTLLGLLAEPTLRFMDWIANARHGMPLPYDYWTQERWRHAFAAVGLSVEETRRRLGLYPFPANLLFERRMHFIVRLAVR